jgi:CheY-like chemotaxis protein
MREPPSGHVARLTAAGRQAFWEAQVRKSTLPKEYLRIMGLVEFQGHPNVIRGYLRRFPDRLIDEWLAELEEAGLLEYVSATGETNALMEFRTVAESAPPLVLDEDRRLISDQSWTAGNVLTSAGAYVAQDRVSNRPIFTRDRGDTDVLIVEDDPDQLALAQRRVRLAGFKTRLADSGKALSAALQEHGAPDLLLLDVMLPDCEGFDVLARLRRDPDYSLLPVVMLTAKADPADIQRGMALGADGYVTKPYSKAVLAQTIEKVLRIGPPVGTLV